MKRITILLLALFAVSANCYSQIRIVKRTYNHGWYISLNDHKKKTNAVTLSANTTNPVVAKKEVKFVPENVASFKEESKMDCVKTNPAHSFAEKNPVAATKQVTKKIMSPVTNLVKEHVHISKVKKNIVRITSTKHNARSMRGDCDMWGIFFKGLLYCIIGLAILALLGSIIEAILLSIYPAATVNLIEWVFIIGFFVLYGLVYGIIWLYKKIADWWSYNHEPAN